MFRSSPLKADLQEQKLDKQLKDQFIEALYAGKAEQALNLLKLHPELKDAHDDASASTPNPALVLAAAYGSLDVAKELVSLKADVNQQGLSDPPLLAAIKGNTRLHISIPGLSKAELEDITKKIKEEDAVKKALKQNQEKVIQFLLDQKDINVKACGRFGMNAITSTVCAADPGRLKLLLSDSRFNVNDRDAEGYSVLHRALSGHEKKLVGYLLNLESTDLNLQTLLSGDTPLHIAINARFYEGIEVLLGLGVRLDIKNNEGYTPFKSFIIKFVTTQDEKTKTTVLMAVLNKMLAQISREEIQDAINYLGTESRVILGKQEDKENKYIMATLQEAKQLQLLLQKTIEKSNDQSIRRAM